ARTGPAQCRAGAGEERGCQMCEHRHTCRAHRGAVATAGRAGAHLRRATGGAARVPAALRRCLSLPAVPLRPEDSVMAVRTCRLVSRTLLGCLVLAGITLAGGVVRAAPSQSSRQGIAYRWVDENGVVHYGDHIPPQYAAQDRAVLNAQGVEVRHFDAQKSPEQAAADARERATPRPRKRPRCATSSRPISSATGRYTPSTRNSARRALLQRAPGEGERQQIRVAPAPRPSLTSSLDRFQCWPECPKPPAPRGE